MRWFYTSDGIVMYVQHELMRTILEKRYKYKINYARQLLHTYFTVIENIFIGLVLLIYAFTLDLKFQRSRCVLNSLYIYFLGIIMG